MASEIKNLRSVTKDGKEENKIPSGSKILKKDVNITVEQIENGFVISKTFDVKYQAPKSTNSDYVYYTKKWYSETNPLEINIGKDKSLAEAFEE